MFKRLENWLPTSYIDELAQVFYSIDVPWYYNESASHPSIVNRIKEDTELDIEESHQFIHMLYDDGPCSEFWELVRPILYFYEFRTQTKIIELGRIKANMLFSGTGLNTPHVDQTQEGWTSLVYYVDDSDGDTVIFDKRFTESYRNIKIVDSNTPKKGTAVTFPSHIMHSSSNPNNTYRRVVLNLVFRTEEKE